MNIPSSYLLYHFSDEELEYCDHSFIILSEDLCVQGVYNLSGDVKWDV